MKAKQHIKTRRTKEDVILTRTRNKSLKPKTDRHNLKNKIKGIVLNKEKGKEGYCTYIFVIISIFIYDSFN